MSTVRIFELAREYGISTDELINRVSQMGIKATDHLTTLDRQQAEQVRQQLNKAPVGGVVEKQVTNTVVRRRRKKKDGPAAAPAPTSAPPQAPPSTPAQARPATPPPAQPAEPAPRRAEPAPPAPVQQEAPKAEPPQAEPAPAAPPVQEQPPRAAAPEPAPATEPPAPAAPQAAPSERAEVVRPPAQATAPEGQAEPAKAEPSLAPAGSKPTMDQAVVVTSHVDRKIADAVARTRAEKGYDRPVHEPEPAGPRGRREAPGTRPAPGAPPGPAGERDGRNKRGGGRRLYYDKRRDHVIRRGMVDADDIFRSGRGKKKRPKGKRSASATPQTQMKEAKRVVKMGSGITIGELAQAMMVKSTQVIGKLMQMGEMATVNQTIDFDTAAALADEFGWRVESVAFELSDYIEQIDDTEDDYEPRPPVVTVMGHVDHGKTSLLDCIRNSRVADGEAGGITQHIGASTVELKGKGTVVFIDTPGHEAFTAMRARGSKATDLVILVVAADDGVMPQTIESINHAKAADVPIVVAVNKIDKDNANPDRVLTELSEHGLVAEDWGGDTVICKVSALKNEGIDHLLEMLLLQAELMELSANTKVPARGIVLEARLERGRGPVATLLVQEGVLKIGANIVCGTESGRVRAMTDDRGRSLKEAGPSTPVEVLGLSGVPDASESFIEVKDDRAATKIVDHRVEEERTAQQAKQRKVSLDSLSEMLAAGEVAELNVIVKADVHGSAEALKDALEKLSHPEVKVKVIHTAVGGINESDVNLASASAAIIIGFNVRPEAKAKRLAEQENVDVKLYSVIYDALDEVKAAMAGMLSPIEREKALGQAEVRATFGVPKHGTIAGCFVTEGTINRGAKVRLIRDNVQIYQGSITSLRRFKNDVREVSSGYECGIGIGYNDIKEGDIIEAFEIEQIAATLD